VLIDLRINAFELPRYDPMVNQTRPSHTGRCRRARLALTRSAERPFGALPGLLALFPDYMRAQAQRAYELRNAAIAKLTTKSAIREPN